MSDRHREVLYASHFLNNGQVGQNIVRKSDVSRGVPKSRLLLRKPCRLSLLRRPWRFRMVLLPNLDISRWTAYQGTRSTLSWQLVQQRVLHLISLAFEIFALYDFDLGQQHEVSISIRLRLW